MRKLLFGLFVGGLLGGGLGFAVGIFIYPFIFLADIEATEVLPDDGQKRVLATGEFIHANPPDGRTHNTRNRMQSARMQSSRRILSLNRLVGTFIRCYHEGRWPYPLAP